MTRIPSDMYPIANKIIASIVEDKKSSKTPREKLEKLFKNPKRLEKLEQFDRIEYQRRLEETNKDAKISQLEMQENINLIITELMAPFKDNRKKYEDLSPKEIFHLLIGDENFKEGQITVATITRIGDTHIKCRLNNGLAATIWFKDIEDNPNQIYSEAPTMPKEEVEKINSSAIQ